MIQTHKILCCEILKSTFLKGGSKLEENLAIAFFFLMHVYMYIIGINP